MMSPSVAAPAALPTRHPDEALLLAYAAGSMPEPTALLVATHLAYCPHCRHAIQGLEAVGGELLDETLPAELASDALERVLGQLNGRDAVPVARPADHGDPETPQPLRDYLGGPLSRVTWERLIPGVRQAKLAGVPPESRLGLLQIKARAGIPWHTHRGGEFIVVLRGSFDDSTGHYDRGDFAQADQELTHRPVAGAGEDCICLTYSEAPMRFTGPFGRLLNPFVR